MSSTLRIASAYFHHIGRREEQQDQLGQHESSKRHRFFVVDGMGGVQGGTAMANVLRKALLTDSDNPVEHAQSVVQSWFAEVFDGVPSEQLPGAVATILDVDTQDGTAVIHHVGDTRLYLLRDGMVTQLTNDQVDRDGNPNQDFGLNVVQPQIEQITLNVGDRFLLCSDGVYRALGHHPMMSLEVYLQQGTIDQACTQLLLGCEADFDDNATAWILEVQANERLRLSTTEVRSSSSIGWILVGCLVAGFGLGMVLDWSGVLPISTTKSQPTSQNPGVGTFEIHRETNPKQSVDTPQQQ